MKLATLNIVAGICLAGTLPTAVGGPARFWITASKTQAFVDMVPTIEAPMGVERTLYIWGRPATNSDGSFKTLQNFSLNLVVPAGRLLTDPMNPMSAPVDPVVDFLDNKIIVHNPEFGGGQHRFQFVHDSTQEDALRSNARPEQVLASDCIPPDVNACKPDGIGTVADEFENISGGDIQGFSLPVPHDGITGVGIAPGWCDGNDFCPASDPKNTAWLVAEVGFETVRPSGINPYFLQIGQSGMNHRNETSNETDVIFSHSGASPVYHASVSALPSDLQTTDEDENPHVWIRALPPPGDYDRSGTVGPEDYSRWKSMFGQSIEPGTGPDGSGNGAIDTADYVVWRDRFRSGGNSSDSISDGLAMDDAVVVPEPQGYALLLGVLFHLMAITSRRSAVFRVQNRAVRRQRLSTFLSTF